MLQRICPLWHNADVTRHPLFVRFRSEADIDRAALTESRFYEYTPWDAAASLTGGER